MSLEDPSEEIMAVETEELLAAPRNQRRLPKRLKISLKNPPNSGLQFVRREEAIDDVGIDRLSGNPVRHLLELPP